MVLNKRVISSLLFFIVLALIFFTPVGSFLKEKMETLTESAPEEKKTLALNESLSNEIWSLKLEGINTNNVDLADFKGKVIFLNFWGTWCPPCLKEMPDIQKLNESFGKDVAFVLISVQDNPEKVKKYLSENSFTMPIYQAESLIPTTLMPNVFPTTYVIDKSGKVVQKVEITKNWNEKETHDLLKNLIQQ